MDFLDDVRPEIDWERRTLFFPIKPRPEEDWDHPQTEHLQEELYPEHIRRYDPALAVTDHSAEDHFSAESHVFAASTLRIAANQSSSTLLEQSLIFDPDEDPDDIADILRVVPSQYHDFVDIFSKARADKLPPHRSYDHSIDLIDPKDIPAVGPIYSLSANEAQTLKSEIDSLLARGFIRPSTAPLGAPVLFVKKPHDTALRMCIDYRQLNLRTKKNKYPLPPINFLLEQLSGAKVFTRIDLRNAYYLLRIAEGDEWKTTFRSRYGSYEFLVMPFGLTNAPSAFQHFVNDILREHLDKFVIAYLDDILIYSNTPQEHEEHVKAVLSALRAANLFAKATKCEFHLPETRFLGYVVGANGIRMDLEKVQAILDWPLPTTVKSVQSFLGFANFYRRFIRNYSKIIAPLTALTKKGFTFEWTSTCTEAFEDLKKRFTSAPILRHFDPSAATYVETDASDYAIGTILSQKGPDGIIHPVAFDSRKFQPAELNYEIHDKELLAIVWALKRWRSMLLSVQSPIQVLTDHQALTYFMSNKQLTRRQCRWAEMLADYDFIITYRAGKKSEKPDALSRRDDVYPSGGDASYAANNPHNFATLLKTHNVSGFLARAAAGATTQTFSQHISAAQREDESLQEHFDNLQNPAAEPIASLRTDDVLLVDGRIAVPADDSVRLRILRQKHDHAAAGHPGISKTLRLIARDYYWPSAKKTVADYISTCVECNRNKTLRQKPFGPLQPLPTPDRAWSSLSMDFIEQLPDSGGFDSILVVVCRFTKMSVFIPTNITATSKDLAELFLQNVWSKHGLPDDIVSDRGSKFVSKFWKALCERLKITRKLSTAYHPQTDGQTERVNQSLEQYIRIYCAYQQNDWHRWLPLAEFAYNNADHSSIGMSPFRANYGFDPTMEVEHGGSAAEPGNHFAYRLEDLQGRIRATLQQAKEDQKRFADRKRQDSPTFEVNDLVFLSTKNLKLARPTRKFHEKYIGPYRVSAKISESAARLDLPQDLSRLHPVFHVSLLRPCPNSSIEGRTVPPPGPVDLEGNEFEISAIVDSRIRRRKLQYKVQWQGYEGHQDEYTWEPAANVKDAQDLVDEFHLQNPNKPTFDDLKHHPSSIKRSTTKPLQEITSLYKESVSTEPTADNSENLLNIDKQLCRCYSASCLLPLSPPRPPPPPPRRRISFYL